MTYFINWPITVRSAFPFRSGNYIFPFVLLSRLMLLLQTEGRRVLSAGRARGDHYKASSFLSILLKYLFYLLIY